MNPGDRRTLWLPPPLWGRVGVGGKERPKPCPIPSFLRGRVRVRRLLPPTPTLPHKGGGSQRLCGRGEGPGRWLPPTPTLPHKGGGSQRPPPSPTRGEGARAALRVTGNGPDQGNRRLTSPLAKHEGVRHVCKNCRRLLVVVLHRSRRESALTTRRQDRTMIVIAPARPPDSADLTPPAGPATMKFYRPTDASRLMLSPPLRMAVPLAGLLLLLAAGCDKPKIEAYSARARCRPG